MTESNDDRSRLRDRHDRGWDTGALIWGLILLAVGIWFFLDNTLGIDLPSIDWGDIWPVILILVGGAVIYSAMHRRTG
jgi:hypothetical protein